MQRQCRTAANRTTIIRWGSGGGTEEAWRCWYGSTPSTRREYDYRDCPFSRENAASERTSSHERPQAADGDGDGELE
jgi:hypothetical protein